MGRGWLPSYNLVNPNFDRFSAKGLHLHRLGRVEWKNVTRTVKEGISVKELKSKFHLAHPIQTKCAMESEFAEGLILEMKRRFRQG